MYFKTFGPFIVGSSCGNRYQKVFKEEESLLILKILV